jgi:DNA helicase-2/ATP-dependent DNA helicase PcrA
MQAGLVPSKYPQQGLTEDTPANWTDIADRLYIDAAPMMLDFARSALIQSIKQSFDGMISFDDQIYMSTMFNGVFQSYSAVLVDEAQDLSPLNHIQIKRSAGTGGQLGVVGDPLQAIYAFRGADSQSMGKLQSLRKDWTVLPLTLTFRCPKVVVGRQQHHAPGFRAWHTNPEGQFLTFRDRDMEAPWSWPEIVALQATPASPIAIICRNNAPLLSMAFRLIRAGVGCTMLGRDLGKNLIALSKKLLPLDDLPADACVKLIDEWAQREIQLARANDKEERVAGITDRQECLIAVIESAGVRNAGELRSALDSLFSREFGLVTLATGHKAKGLEWDIVIHLDPWRVPSKFARQMADAGDPSALQQELNLRYVIETRAKHVLVEANGEDFQS